MELLCFKGLRGVFRKGKIYYLKEYPVEDYYFEAIEDDKRTWHMVSKENERDMEWVKKHFIIQEELST